MKDPVRRRERADAPGGAPELVRTAAAPSPPSAKGAATSRWPSLAAKAAFVVGLGGASGYAVHAIATHRAIRVQALAASAQKEELAAPGAVPTVRIAEPAEALPALQLPTAPPDRAPRLRLDRRLEEAQLLERARSLVASDPAAALKLASEHARDFPEGHLRAEAELIGSQALLALGDKALAKQRAAESLERDPNSPYAPKLREIAAH